MRIISFMSLSILALCTSTVLSAGYWFSHEKFAKKFMQAYPVYDKTLIKNNETKNIKRKVDVRCEMAFHYLREESQRGTGDVKRAELEHRKAEDLITQYKKQYTPDKYIDQAEQRLKKTSRILFINSGAADLIKPFVKWARENNS